MRSYLFIGNKKCRIYAACGVSQTPNYFITDNGDIIIIEPGDIQTYAGCSHIFVNGKHKNHSRNKNGGCTVKTYKGKICTKCNYTKDFSLDSTVTYSPCPH